MPKPKTFFILFIAFISVTSLQAQKSGIAFESNSDWATVLAKAKADNKYIFVDCYTTWCAPCKYMDREVFPQKATGDFFNDKFISVKFQMDSTSADEAGIRAQYADAALIREQYHVEAYPTYLFFNSNGELVQVESGSYPVDEFIAKGRNALDTNHQYITQVKKYEAGYRDAAFLMNLTRLAQGASDDAAAAKYAEAYMHTQADLLSDSNLKFIYQTTRAVSDTGFKLMLNNLNRFEAVVERARLLKSLKNIVVLSAFSDTSIKPAMNDEQWKAYDARLRSLYPAFGEEAIIAIKRMFFSFKNDWTHFAEASETYAHSKAPLAEELNQCAWTLFQKCSDQNLLAKALIWSKQSFSPPNQLNPSFIDTYANLLYKTGRKPEAIAWEKKAQGLARQQGEDRNWGADVIYKMERGEKTW